MKKECNKYRPDKSTLHKTQ